MQNNDATASALGAMGLSDLSGELKSMMDSVVDPPPGTDEIVALARVSTTYSTVFMISATSQYMIFQLVCQFYVGNKLSRGGLFNSIGENSQVRSNRS